MPRGTRETKSMLRLKSKYWEKGREGRGKERGTGGSANSELSKKKRIKNRARLQGGYGVIHDQRQRRGADAAGKYHRA